MGLLKYDDCATLKERKYNKCWFIVLLLVDVDCIKFISISSVTYVIIIGNWLFLSMYKWQDMIMSGKEKIYYKHALIDYT